MIHGDNNRLQFHTQHLEISTSHSSLEAARKTLQVSQNKQFAPSTSYQDGEKPIDNSPKLTQKQSTHEQSNANSNWRIDKRNPMLRIYARLQLKQEYYYKINIAPTSETNTLSKER
jgi:hypothetical protein